MRKYLLASILLAIGLARAPSAQAQVPVIDSSNLAQNIVTAAQEIQAVEQLRAQLTELQNTYTMFTSTTNIMGMAPGMENQAIENPMPTANALSGLIGGQISATGPADTYYQQSHIFTPTDGTAQSNQINANAESIANIQGIAATNLAAIEQRLQQLPDLESDLQAATSITQLNAISGRIAVESQFVQAQQAQASNLQVLAMEQEASHQQQLQEAHQESDADALNALNSASP
jgi:type IV secretion system protein VirB5